MIPSALIARLRMLAESSIRSTEPVRPVHADPPPLSSGERVRALIQSARPDGTFHAEIAGKSFTLSLPTPAKPGDRLDLVITGRTSHAGDDGIERTTITARLAEPPAAHTPPPQLSRTALLIGGLLSAPMAKPITLAQGAALVPQPDVDPTQLAVALREGVTRSGAFYEAHQALWVDGQSTLGELMQEPQARLPLGTKLAWSAQPEPPARRETTASSNLSPSASPSPSPGERTAPTIDEPLIHEIRTIVHKQLDTIATHQMSWAVQIWPGQQLLWEIDAPPEREPGGTEESAAEWRTKLRLTLPRLGALAIDLAIAGNRVRMHLLADQAEHADQLGMAGPALATALEAAGLQLCQVKVDHIHV